MAPISLAKLFLCAAMAAAQEDSLIADLDASNFDEMLEDNTEVLVVFWAPWSKKANKFFADYEKVAKEFEAKELEEKVIFGRCDITSPLKPSYLAKHGVERLPTLVLFRNGDPFQYEGNELDHRTISTFLTNAISEDPPARKSAKKKPAVPKIGDDRKDKRQLAAEGDKDSSREATIAAQKAKAEQPAEGSVSKEEEQAVPAAATTSSATTPNGLCGVPSSIVDVSDATFKTVVLDKAADVIVQFFKPGADFCDKSGKAFDTLSVGMTSKTLRVARMDCAANKSPFVFEDNELPVAMMFPANAKAPIEYDQAWTEDKLVDFVKEHMSKKEKEEL